MNRRPAGRHIPRRGSGSSGKEGSEPRPSVTPTPGERGPGTADAGIATIGSPRTRFRAGGGAMGTCTARSGSTGRSWSTGSEGSSPITTHVTLRQLWYRAISEGLVPNTPSMYRRLSSRLAQARREGRFPDLVDTLREVHLPPAWTDDAAFLEQAPDRFRPDRARGREVAVYVAAKKPAGCRGLRPCPHTACAVTSPGRRAVVPAPDPDDAGAGSPPRRLFRLPRAPAHPRTRAARTVRRHPDGRPYLASAEAGDFRCPSLVSGAGDSAPLSRGCSPRRSRAVG